MMAGDGAHHPLRPQRRRQHRLPGPRRRAGARCRPSTGRSCSAPGDGFLSVFDGGPGRAVRCARALRDRVVLHRIELRIGLHTGECEVSGDDVAGMAVHIAARVGALAQGREILVSGTTYGTIVGAGLDFDYRGEHRLKACPGAGRCSRSTTDAQPRRATSDPGVRARARNGRAPPPSRRHRRRDGRSGP